MSDIAATPDGQDIDFTRDRLVSGIEEYPQAALSRVSNEVSYVNDDYGIDLVLELGKTGAESTIGIRASAAIMNDDRFTSAALSNQAITKEGDTVSAALSFDVIAQDGQELSLNVLVANGEVVLVP